jgi:AraC family transcriptional regulator, alkane utilization regulator
MDVLSDVLRVVRLTSAVFFTAKFSSPWAIKSPPPDQLARSLNLRAECIALFHVVVEGGCWVGVEGHKPFRIEAHDVIIFPHGEPHTMSSDLGARWTPIGALLTGKRSNEILTLDYGGNGETSRFVCGYLHCDQRFNPLIGALPTMICVCGPNKSRQAISAIESAKNDGLVLVEADGWLSSTLHHTIEEANTMHPGSSAMLVRLTELLYVEVLRRYMQQIGGGQTGWLAGVQDAEVGRALRLLHAQPEREWTIEELAREVGVSRSGLAQRFTELTGESPMRYLTGWRIQLAKNLMLQLALPIAEVADRVGYESEAAFNRAFKRNVGVPPATWRKRSA